MFAELMLLAAVAVNTAHFALTLSGTWERVASKDSIAYRRGADTVFITTYAPAEPLSKSELVSRAKQIATMRRDLINDLARGQATSSDVVRSERNDQIAFSFDGEDRRNDKRYAITVVALSKVVVTVALYRPITEADAGFVDLQRDIVSTLRDQRSSAVGP